uniref:Uncharacterized protein n=1 Tax=Neolamprologus brichardi TaxID=32507 RepID=A0A3Q4MFZ7_NEOBR
VCNDQYFIFLPLPLFVRVFVADSTIRGAGQGLFAKTDAEANTVMAFYNGVHFCAMMTSFSFHCLNPHCMCLLAAVYLTEPPSKHHYLDPTVFVSSVSNCSAHTSFALIYVSQSIHFIKCNLTDLFTCCTGSTLQWLIYF